MSCKHLIDAPGTILLASNKAYLSWGIINVLLHVVLGGDTRTLYADSWPGLCATGGTRLQSLTCQVARNYIRLRSSCMRTDRCGMFMFVVVLRGHVRWYLLLHEVLVTHKLHAQGQDSRRLTFRQDRRTFTCPRIWSPEFDCQLPTTLQQRILGRLCRWAGISCRANL